jgi:hypothetical protein
VTKQNSSASCLPILMLYPVVRLKRNSRILQRAQHRLSGIQAIDKNLEIGSGYSAKKYACIIEELSSALSAYNTALSKVDALKANLNATEKELADYSERMLLGVAAKFGKNSQEYEMAGGTRKSSTRKRSAPPLEETE